MDGPKTVPLCKCHDQPMKRASKRRSGRMTHYWRCRVKANEAQQRYLRTLKGKAASRRYDKSGKGRATAHRYNMTEKGRARGQRRRDNMTWRQKHADQLRVRRYKALQRQAQRQEREERSG
jgi:hypothetical protein